MLLLFYLAVFATFRVNISAVGSPILLNKVLFGLITLYGYFNQINKYGNTNDNF